MKPGLTGLWKVSGRTVCLSRDGESWIFFYIENWSVLFDLKIILRTVLVMLRGEATNCKDAIH